MIRHIEFIKLKEVVDGKFRAEQIEEIKGTLEGLAKSAEGVAAYLLNTRSDTLDPMEADIMLQIDFESADALDEFELDVDRLAANIKISENAISMLYYDYEA